MTKSTSSQRRVVYFRGRVQGVGFRYTTQRVAAGYAVTGFVQNLPDGRVLVVCEGTAAELDAFLGELRSTMEHYIGGEQTSVEPAQGEFEEFFIEH